MMNLLRHLRSVTSIVPIRLEEYGEALVDSDEPEPFWDLRQFLEMAVKR